MIADVFYYDASTGHRLSGFDSNVGRQQIPDEAPQGEIAHVVRLDVPDSWWLDERGVIQENDPRVVRTLSGREWCQRHLGLQHFNADRETAEFWLQAVVIAAFSGQRADHEFESIRRTVETGGRVTLYEKKVPS